MGLPLIWSSDISASELIHHLHHIVMQVMYQFRRRDITRRVLISEANVNTQNCMDNGAITFENTCN